MRSPARPTIALVGLAAAGLLLAGCGQSASTTPTPAPAAASPTADSSSPVATPVATESPTAPSTPTASSSPTTAEPAAIKDACKAISVTEMEKLVDADLGTAKDSSQTDSNTCIYSLTGSGRTLVVTGAGITVGTLKDEAGDIQKGFPGSKLSTTTVSGTDEALLLKASPSGATATGVLARKGGYFYLALVVGTKSADTYEKIDKKVIATLMAS